MLAGHIGHVQFADCPGRGAPGSGTLDFVAARQALRTAGYAGWLAAEYRPGEEGTAASLSWLAEWRSR
ncbi:Hydroxypyruvate isomerase [compost metagenome]